MFVVNSVDVVKSYYEILNKLQADSDKLLKIVIIFFFVVNEE